MWHLFKQGESFAASTHSHLAHIEQLVPPGPPQCAAWWWSKTPVSKQKLNLVLPMLFVIRMDILNFWMETIVSKLEPWKENSYYSKKHHV